VQARRLPHTRRTEVKTRPTSTSKAVQGEKLCPYVFALQSPHTHWSDDQMDSISRKSQAHQQYNARPPRSGPSNLSTRQPGIHKTSSSSTATDGKLPKMKKAASSMVVSRRNSSASTAYTASIPDMRRIATNSRLRQREQNQRDGYLAFAVNALQEKANVSKL
jgi:hypothetical protein